jgi:hypothetical protein
MGHRRLGENLPVEAAGTPFGHGQPTLFDTNDYRNTASVTNTGAGASMQLLDARHRVHAESRTTCAPPRTPAWPGCPSFEERPHKIYSHYGGGDGRGDPPATRGVVIVIDASAMVHALIGWSVNPRLLALLAVEDLWAPHLIDLEVASALRGHVLVASSGIT